jgi:hypothetical protein
MLPSVIGPLASRAAIIGTQYAAHRLIGAVQKARARRRPMPVAPPAAAPAEADAQSPAEN